MKRFLVVLAAALSLTGCAGGWRNGPPAGHSAGTPASLVPGGSAAIAAAPATAAKPPAAKPAAKPAGAAPAAGADGVTFTYRGDGGSVAVAGEFNGWNTSADPMAQQADGSWTLVKKLDPGRYAYKFVIDGGTWKEDPTAAEFVDDGYGGKNSILVVGAGAAAATPATAQPAAKPAGTAPFAGADGVTFTYRGDGGSVAVAGEFNGWNTSADPMAKQADGSWTLVKKLDPGRYAYKFVIDGGTWKEDPTAAEFVDDGYGGKNSILVVSAGVAAPATGAGAAPAAEGVPVTGRGRAPVVTAAGVTFTFAGEARSVSLAGEFNAWAATADPMTKQADGTWTIVRKLAPGTYQYKFLVNGSTWKQDEANPEARDDGFGGKNSVVTVK
jgi:1,4-alpha-glucan branching enzyme